MVPQFPAYTNTQVLVKFLVIRKTGKEFVRKDHEYSFEQVETERNLENLREYATYEVRFMTTGAESTDTWKLLKHRIRTETEKKSQGSLNFKGYIKKQRCQETLRENCISEAKRGEHFEKKSQACTMLLPSQETS